MALWNHRIEQSSRSVSRDKRGPQAGPACGLSNAASKAADASGGGISVPDPNTETPEKVGAWRACRSLSAWRAEADARNRGGLPLQFPRFGLAGWESRCTVEDGGLLLPLGFVPAGGASLHAEHGRANAVCYRIEVHSP
jgi:hypothetical protein